ncbi:hypothetical protein [Paraburkholderia bannensis]|uniref:hypothetical protein n=1 Tax=Paraburkholderia bannensis TaxID=765414 RepID=UPI0012EC3D36|nr:hypothetical protein [Paraburkholderia bannensis]
MLWDELDVKPDVERAPRFYCAECRRATLFDRDLDGYPICRECAEDEVEHV